MDNTILLKRPGVEIGERREYERNFEVEPFSLYGRDHEVVEASAIVGVTRLTEGLHLDMTLAVKLTTSCDRTLEPVELDLEFEESELVEGADDSELCIEDWTLDLSRYTERALPAEIPMKVCAPGTELVSPEQREDEVDPRWKGLDGLFASGF